MSEQSEKVGKARAPRWSENEARDTLRQFHESGLSASDFAAARGISPSRLSYWAERLGTGRTEAVDFVTVSLPEAIRVGVELEHEGVKVRVSGLAIEELAQLVVAIGRRARGC